MPATSPARRLPVCSGSTATRATIARSWPTTKSRASVRPKPSASKYATHYGRVRLWSYACEGVARGVVAPAHKGAKACDAEAEQCEDDVRERCHHVRAGVQEIDDVQQPEHEGQKSN